MKREIVLSLLCAAAVLTVVGACDDSVESACRVDTDCPQGTICREQRCGPVSVEGGAPPPDAAQTTCSTDGLSCIAPEECCSRACTSGRCGSAPIPTTPTCRGLYELCQNDCCTGLTCTNGTCR